MIEEELDVLADTARQIYNRYLQREDTENASRSGVPKKLTATALRHINRHIRHDRETRRQPLDDITKQLQLEVGVTTLRKTIIQDLGLGHRIQRKTPWLTNEQKAKRLAFAKEHIHWSEEEWRRVGWSDEMAA